MELNLDFLKPQERVSLQLRMLYEKAGFLQYHMGRFEEYSLYQENRRFLPSEQLITFTDLSLIHIFRRRYYMLKISQKLFQA